MKTKESLVQYWHETGTIKDENLIRVFEELPREKFIRAEFKTEAYGDYPLPIKAGQTISQPTTVMIMTEALELKKGLKVLEVGTGSGYQSALIASLVEPAKVFSLEIISDLHLFAKSRLKKAGINNVELICGDGSLGYPKEAPFDRIIITAACPKIPEPLIDQLIEGGIIIAPVGSNLEQKMVKAVKIKGKIKEETLGDFVFVPLVGKHGF